MILSAAGTLTNSCRFKLGNDLVDVRSVALDRMRDRAATQRTEPFPVSREIHLRDRNILTLDVAPDIHFGPIEQWLDANVLAFGRAGCELSPEFRRLVFVIPFELRIAQGKISFLYARRTLFAHDSDIQHVHCD